MQKTLILFTQSINKIKKKEKKSKKNYKLSKLKNIKFLEKILFKQDDLQNFRVIKNGIED